MFNHSGHVRRVDVDVDDRSQGFIESSSSSEGSGGEICATLGVRVTVDAFPRFLSTLSMPCFHTYVKRREFPFKVPHEIPSMT